VSEYPYVRGERRLVINTKESKLVQSINISMFLYDHVVRTKAFKCQLLRSVNPTTGIHDAKKYAEL
jgi:hypothetical protein